MTRPVPPSGQSLSIATPKSSLWRGLLATASAAATALCYELARTLVADTFGGNPAVQRILQAMRWLPLVIVAVAGGYVAYRTLHSVRDRRRRARDADLLADLMGPGHVAVEGMSPPRAGAAPGVNATVPQAAIGAVIRVLRQLPIGTYRRTGFMVMLGAMLEAPARIPARDTDDWTLPPGAPAVVLAELFSRRELALDGPDAYRCMDNLLTAVPPAPEVVVAAMRAAALPALIAYHADRATRWAKALDTFALGAAARGWFAEEGAALRGLIVDCGPPTALPANTIRDLARIADALDTWYAGLGADENGPTATVPPLPEAVLRLRGIENDSAARELARIRSRGHHAPSRRSGARLRSSLAARREHRRALSFLRRYRPPAALTGAAAVRQRAAVVQRRLAAAERILESAWWLLPRADVAGEVSTLVNLAVVHLHQGRYDAAGDRLELAEALTRNGIDPVGRAHAYETMGVLMWARKEPEGAVRYWQGALRDFRALRHEPGIARCLQHLGSAAVAAPRRIGGLVLPGDGRVTTVEVLRQATGWLAEADRLGTGTGLAGDYRAEALAVLPASVGPLNEIDRWPLAAEEAG
ncbi:tetratricopeptide repeat protein [Nocardia sp. 2]|uniref:Tetratricopeptide repeat protein n=1 Tax=Nocardia acididurans TaxID=2802282 RepID=A0ABS1M7N4_9NOCA|nr:tetratricopeptide repeat protein [Nocardia acididurans]MBL1076652.1 tetratricopeptide repeat protein [Nocardia acididurans]